MSLFDTVFNEIAGDVNALWRSSLNQDSPKAGMQLENLALRNQNLRETLADKALDRRLKVQKQQWDQHLGDVKLAFGVYEKAFSNPALSEASRENMMEMASMLRSSLTPMELNALGAIGSIHMLSGEEQRAQEFDRRFPEPQMPTEGFVDLPHTPENTPTWARYYIQQAERAQKKAIAIYGLEKGKAVAPLPKLFQTDEKNVYAFRNPLTRQISLMNLKEDIPEGMLDRAINEGKTSLSEIANSGGLPIPGEKSREITYHGKMYKVEPWFDLIKGEKGVKTSPMGPAQPENLPATLRNVMFAQGIKDEDLRDKLLKSPEERGLADTLADAIGTKDPVEKASKFGVIRAQLQSAYPNASWLPFPITEQKANFWNILPWGKDSYHQKDSGVVWIQTTGVKKFIDANGEVFTAYDTPNGVPVDGKGKPIPEAKGKQDGDQVPVVVSRAPAAQNLTVGDAANMLAKSFIGGPDTKEAAKVIESYSKKWNSGKPLDTESFVKLWRRIMAIPRPTFHALEEFREWLANIEIPGTGGS